MENIYVMDNWLKFQQSHHPFSKPLTPLKANGFKRPPHKAANDIKHWCFDKVHNQKRISFMVRIASLFDKLSNMYVIPCKNEVC